MEVLKPAWFQKDNFWILSLEYRDYQIDESDRRNGGRIRDKLLRRYGHTEHGGWWCSGIDVLTGLESLWGQFKPNLPYRYENPRNKGFGPPKKEKFVKYEPPKGVPTEIFALKVPLDIWQAIAARYDVPLPENIAITSEGRAIGFWAWVIANPKIPIIITEGAKKAGCLITAEFVAIALPGIYNGYRQPKDDYGNKIGSARLIPQLKAFAQENREITFCYDNDVKPKTIKNVRRAIEITGKLFLKEGCRVSAITWNYPEKGVDDLIAARGVECFDELYQARQPLSKFNLIGLLDLSKYNPLKINQRYLDENLVAPDDAQIIALKSPKGSNKTGWIVAKVQQAIAQGIPVLVITHRIQLAKALCARFGIDHIEEVRSSETKGVFGYGLCIDSLHQNSQALFDPEDWAEAIVILDECEQVIWHMLDSHTCFDNRVAIIENFQQLLQTVVNTGGKIYLADADLSCIAIDYVQKLIGGTTTINTWVVDNVYAKSRKRLLYSYSGGDPRELVAALVNAIRRGEKALVHVTGQKAKSNWGSTNLESYLKKEFPEARILRIDGESVSDPHHPAMGCMANLNNILSHYDIAIASPVIETGVSIDIKGHFDSVWCIAQGVQTVDAVCQALERLRDGVPRHIWVKTTAKGNRIGNGSTSVKGLLASQHKLTTANMQLLQLSGVNDFDELEVNFSVESLVTWAKRACLINAGKNNYRESVISKLLETCYELAPIEEIKGSKIVKDNIKGCQEENYQQECQTIPKMADLTISELEKLNNKKNKTKEERYRERKGNLKRRYGVEVTPELIEKDDKGWYPQLQLHYYLTVGKAYLAEKDRRSLAIIEKQGQGKAFKPDLNKKQLSAKVKALKLINIEQFFETEAEFTKDSLIDWLNNDVLPFRSDLKLVLGVTVNPEKDSPIAVAQRFLAKLGLKLEFKCWRGNRKNKHRLYSGCQLEKDKRSLILNYWLSKESVL